jgi:subtilase family serine protease
MFLRLCTAVTLLSAAAMAAGSRPVCPGPAASGDARCHARVAVDNRGNPVANIVPSGYGSTQFQTAYSLPSVTSGIGQMIAIVDAYDDPNIEKDLAVYSSQNGLPLCTTANTCFKKVNQTGGTKYPRSNSGWALEISLDVEIAHALCPNCKILLVEASSNSYANLLAAEDYARAHATVVSNSWGGGESSSETSYDSHFVTKGIPTTFSTGDNGYGVEYPAASQYVTAVGGTTLNLTSSYTRLTETVWSGTGSGCSAYEPKPSWQTDTSGCSRRTVGDVAADADPNTGAAIYDSVSYLGQSGWFQVGGTSLASPIIAATYALAGNGTSTIYGSYPYNSSSYLFDVTSGSNGSCGSSAYLCTGEIGYDGPTGNGTPDGVGAF